MPQIDLNEFIEMTKAYQTSPYGLNGIGLYQETVRQRNVWDRLAGINELKTKKVVLKFVNSWRCRLSYDCAASLAEALRESSSSLAKFRSLSLQKVDLNFLITDESLLRIFSKIATVQAGRRSVGATATSKILHMINPDFFVMSDENIRYGYGCSDNALGYSNFMFRVKLFANSVLEKYSYERKIPIESAFQELVIECRSEAMALPKLIDEYNWVKFNQ